jgi:hypothetical protein
MRLLSLLFLAGAACAGVSETGLVGTPTLERAARGNPAFTDSAMYNEWDMCGSPLGLLEAESADMRFSVGYKNYNESGSGDSAAYHAHVAQLPDILIGKHETVYLGLAYEPSWLKQDFLSTESMFSPLHRFGLLLATQTGNKHFRFGIRGQGFIGTQNASNAAGDTRAAMGVNALSMYVGSEVHPLVRIGLYGGVTAALDSLKDLEPFYPEDPLEDRYFYGSIPTFGGDVSIGGSDIPVRSILAVNIAKNHFVYVTKPSAKPNGNENAIVGDSVNVAWNSSGDIPAGSTVIQPALSLGYMHSGVKLRAPGAKNYPLSYGELRTDSGWTISNFTLGIGSGVKIANYAHAYVEYGHDFFALSYKEGMDLPNSQRGFDRFALGADGNLHAIPYFNFPSSIELFLRCGYTFIRTDSRFGQYYRDEFREFSAVNNGSLLNDITNPYEPKLGGDLRLSRFSLGTGATFLDKALGIDLLLAFSSLKHNRAYNSTEFGAKLFYALSSGK